MARKSERVGTGGKLERRRKHHAEGSHLRQVHFSNGFNLAVPRCGFIIRATGFCGRPNATIFSFSQDVKGREKRKLNKLN